MTIRVNDQLVLWAKDGRLKDGDHIRIDGDTWTFRSDSWFFGYLENAHTKMPPTLLSKLTAEKLELVAADRTLFDTADQMIEQEGRDLKKLMARIDRNVSEWMPDGIYGKGFDDEERARVLHNWSTVRAYITAKLSAK